MLADEEVGAVFHLLFVHSIDGFLSGLPFLEGDVSFVCEDVARLSSSLSLHMSRLNLTKVSKHSFQTIVAGAFGQALHEDVEEAAFSIRALLASLMGQHLDLLAIELELLGLLDGCGGGILALKLDVAEAARLAVGVKLELARANGADCLEGFVELLLGDTEVDVAHEHVSLRLHEVAFLEVAANEVSTNLCVVHLGGAATRLFGREELEEAVAVLTLGLLINIDERLEDCVA